MIRIWWNKLESWSWHVQFFNAIKRENRLREMNKINSFSFVNEFKIAAVSVDFVVDFSKYGIFLWMCFDSENFIFIIEKNSVGYILIKYFKKPFAAEFPVLISTRLNYIVLSLIFWFLRWKKCHFLNKNGAQKDWHYFKSTLLKQ